MTGRHEESELAWGPGAAGQPGAGGAGDDAARDFGPAPEIAADLPEVAAQAQADHPLENEATTDHTKYPDTSGPHAVAGPGQSGPHQVPGPGQSGPHQVPGQSGPHPVPGQQPGYYAEPTPSGPQPMQQYNPQQYAPQPHMAPQHGGFAPPQPPGPPSDELTSARLIKQTKRTPQSGWRRAVYVASGHLINVGESPADKQRRDLIARVNQPLRGCYKIAMLSLKGGVGKTTTTTTLGSTYSSLRGDRVIAVDANPDRGTLSQKIPLETTATVRHLLRDAGRIRRYSDIRAYTSQGPSRLEVLASEQDPAVSEAFSEDDYRRTVALLEHFYNIVLTDCGTGLMHSAMKGVLDIADSLVIVSSGSVDGARSASATLDWLDAHGYRDLVARSVAVINSVRPKSGSVDLDKLSQHFAARCRAVCRIPFDPHLEEGAEIELERLQPDTRLALLDMAATVADDFPNEARRTMR
ncbi:MinD/ParA family ATP-binding protein [Actinokineospora pegani]|uniref:MinD/ParA family ATP-binding protein n=1 Tax=Actinokineospora pegani TaxID=2654637 RepID=UPI0012EA43C0|nr:MinD/ParA family protein [Actinokineospora pegani]